MHQASNSDDDLLLRALNWEHDVWLDLDKPRIARIFDKITPFMPTLIDIMHREREHWYWRGGLHAGQPSTRFGTSNHVPVVRVLWATHRNHPPLYDGKGPVLRPRRDKRKCIEWNCVNPHHFEPSIPVRLGRDVTAIAGGNYARSGVLPPRNHYWNMSSPSVPDETGVFERLVLCKAGHPLGPTAQIKYNAALKGALPLNGIGYCSRCNKKRKDEGPAAPRRLNVDVQTQQWLQHVPTAPPQSDEPVVNQFTLDPDAGVKDMHERPLTDWERDHLFDFDDEK